MSEKIILLLLIVSLLSGCESKVEKILPLDENKNPDIEISKALDEISHRELKSVYDRDDDTSVIIMYLTVSQGNRVDSSDYTWDDVNSHSIYYYEDLGIDRYAVEGLIQVGDENGPVPGFLGYGKSTPNANVTVRGKTTSRGVQKSYKITLNKNEDMWRGQTIISLNKHIFEPARFFNKLSFDLLKTIPEAFSARTQFVHLYVKDMTVANPQNAKFEDYGLFTQVEQINKKYLRAHGLDEGGNLYKAQFFEFLRYEDDIKLITDPAFDELKFATRLTSKGSDDHSKLITMLSELNNYSTPIEAVFEKYFDADNYFTWLAFQILTGNIDTINQNFYIYSPQHGNKWYFLSWDNDDAWRNKDKSEKNTVYGSNFERGVSNYWGNMLHQRVLKSEKYREMLDVRIKELAEEFPKERLKEYIDKYAAVVKPYLFRAPDSAYLVAKTEGEYNSLMAVLPEEFEFNYEAYRQSLKKPAPFYLDVPNNINDKTIFAWEASYDFNDLKITYIFEVSRDYTFNSPIARYTDLQIPQASVPKLSAGDYYYRVTAVNESGEWQTAMELYTNERSENFYGVRTFTVDLDGSIT